MKITKMKSIRIFLADDDEDDRSFFREGLSDSGIAAEFTGVEGGQQLIDLLSSLPPDAYPDVIFLDINMPGMDGRVCLREIRKQAVFSATPVIMLSTSTNPRDIEETYKAGANKYISKTAFFGDSAKWMIRLLSSGWEQAL